MKSQRGSIGLNIMLVLMLAVIGILTYLLLNGGLPSGVSSHGAQSPTHTDMAPRPNAHKSGGFTDGLPRPDSATEYELDEIGDGVSNVAVFNHDINGDGQIDRITRTHHESGNAHFYDEYRIELNNDGFYINITPDGFRTTQGAECALQKLRFSFQPKFSVTKISRNWVDSWNTPSPAKKTVYELRGRELVPVSTADMGTVCDVTDLFVR